MEPTGHDIIWLPGTSFLTAASGRSIGSILRQLNAGWFDWVVLVRHRQWTGEIFYYAYELEEIYLFADEHRDHLDAPLEELLELREGMRSERTHGGRPFAGDPPPGGTGPAASRVVDFDAAGEVVRIGHHPRELPEAAPPARVHSGPLTGPYVGSGASQPPSLPAEGNSALGKLRNAAAEWETEARQDDAVLSAEVRHEIPLGATERVAFQIELAEGAIPLEHSLPVTIGEKRIRVSLSVEGDVLEVVGRRDQTVDAPVSGEPRTGFFRVKAVAAGQTRLAVTFHQVGTELGVITLATDVVGEDAREEVGRATAAAAPWDASDDDKLILTVDRAKDGDGIRYEYFLYCDRLGRADKIHSKPLLDRGGGHAATEMAFVERIYDQVNRDLDFFDVSDLRQFQREARALGADLCHQLFDPEVTRLLWPLRDRLKTIQVVSWVPQIPWELTRLRNPDNGEIDDRFLAEYGLVRTRSGVSASRHLDLRQWSYLGGDFPHGSYPSVGADLAFFTQDDDNALRARGIEPLRIEPNLDDVYEALASGAFDVFHISCHGESDHGSIDRAQLIIGDQFQAGAEHPKLTTLDTTTVQAEANFAAKRPLVFLNACETGRSGAVLTAWGGWPNTFLDAGAGAFVGTAWPVRDKAAAVFSTAFYNALLDGEALHEAATAARTAAKNLGDASWLAFKVFGHPRARMTRQAELDKQG